MEEAAINPTIELPELTQDWGNRTLGGHKQNLVCTRTQEKGEVPPQETDPDSRECSGVSSGGVGQWWPAAGSGALSMEMHAQDL